ncbi:MAG: hypothetical protein PHC75_03505 [Burkholderiales bacterium]|nr:hypothetical protein [Burkholderiales bacterium]
MKKMFFLSLLFINQMIYASTPDVYNEVINNAGNDIENYSSENRDVQIEIFYNKTNSKATGYVNSLVLCNVLGCKTYKYKPFEVKVVPTEVSYAYFKAPISDGTMAGFICSDASTPCSSRVSFDMKTQGKSDFETKFLMQNKTPIQIKRLSKSYL